MQLQRLVAGVVATLSLALPVMNAATAAPVTLTFEGLGEFEYVLGYYDGGYGSKGSGPGPDHGVVFPGTTYSSIDADAGGNGNFGGEPSPDTAVSFQQSGAFMNVADGFRVGLTFHYSNPNGPNTIRIYDGVNGTGNLLAALFLPQTPYQGHMDPTGNLGPFVRASVGFEGIARSVDFIELAHRAYMDDITLGVHVVPLPPAALLLVTAFAGAFTRVRLRRPTA